jgi:hypothetical protein
VVTIKNIMKKIMFPFAVLAIAATTSCNNSSDNDKTQVKDTIANSTTENTTVHTKRIKAGKPVEVMPVIQTKFTEKYPTAKEVEWTKYDQAMQPIDIDWDLAGWAPLDTSIYTATYVIDTTDYWSWYTPSGDWIATVSTYPANGLPDAVNKTIQDQFPGYTVTSVNKENDKNRTAYEIKMEKGADKMKALIDESGNVMKKKGKENGEKVKEKNV